MKHLLIMAMVAVTGMTAFGKPMTGSVSTWEGEFVLSPTNFNIKVAGKPTLTLWLYELKTGSAGIAVGFSDENGDMLLAPHPQEKGVQPIYQNHVVTFTTNGNAEVVVAYKIQGQGGQTYVEKYEYDGTGIRLTAKSVHGGRHDPVWHKADAEEASQPATKAAPDDRIAALVKRLDASHGLWVNGLFPTIRLPATASVAEVLAEATTKAGFDKGHIQKYSILETRKVTIRGAPSNDYTALLIDSDLGRKILLMQYEGEATGWWTRFFDAEK